MRERESPEARAAGRERQGDVAFRSFGHVLAAPGQVQARQRRLGRESAAEGAKQRSRSDVAVAEGEGAHAPIGRSQRRCDVGSGLPRARSESRRWLLVGFVSHKKPGGQVEGGVKGELCDGGGGEAHRQPLRQCRAGDGGGVVIDSVSGADAHALWPGARQSGQDGLDVRKAPRQLHGRKSGRGEGGE